MRLLKIVIFAICLPLVLSYVVYFGFITNYTSNVFTEDSFEAQYEQGIYRYRYLSRPVLEHTHELLQDLFQEDQLTRLAVNNQEISSHFYYSYFAVNSLFYVLTCLFLFLIFDTSYMSFQSVQERLALFTGVVLLIAITQFVVTPYDQISYFFEVLAIFMILRWVREKKKGQLLLICLLVVLATLNRESSAIILSIMATMVVARYGISMQTGRMITFPLLCFIITYFGIRVVFGFDTGFFERIQLKANLLRIESQIGILFWLLLFSFAFFSARQPVNRYYLLLFHFFSLPYIFMCLLTGMMFELRLYIPLFLGSIIIASADEKHFHFRPRIKGIVEY